MTHLNYTWEDSHLELTNPHGHVVGEIAVVSEDTHPPMWRPSLFEGRVVSPSNFYSLEAAKYWALAMFIEWRVADKRETDKDRFDANRD